MEYESAATAVLTGAVIMAREPWCTKEDYMKIAGKAWDVIREKNQKIQDSIKEGWWNW